MDVISNDGALSLINIDGCEGEGCIRIHCLEAAVGHQIDRTLGFSFFLDFLCNRCSNRDIINDHIANRRHLEPSSGPSRASRQITGSKLIRVLNPLTSSHKDGFLLVIAINISVYTVLGIEPEMHMSGDTLTPESYSVGGVGLGLQMVVRDRHTIQELNCIVTRVNIVGDDLHLRLFDINGSNGVVRIGIHRLKVTIGQQIAGNQYSICRHLNIASHKLYRKRVINELGQLFNSDYTSNLSLTIGIHCNRTVQLIGSAVDQLGHAFFGVLLHDTDFQSCICGVHQNHFNRIIVYFIHINFTVQKGSSEVCSTNTFIYGQFRATDLLNMVIQLVSSEFFHIRCAIGQYDRARSSAVICDDLAITTLCSYIERQIGQRQ